jgi:hypothetical protein
LLQLVGACHGPFYCWTQLDSPVFSKLFFNSNFVQRLMGCKFNVWEHHLEPWNVSQSSQIPQLDPIIYSYIYIYMVNNHGFPLGHVYIHDVFFICENSLEGNRQR